MVAMSEARATHSSPLGKNQCVDQSSAALYIFQCGVFYKFKSASSTGVAQPQKCNLFTNRKIAKVYKSMIKVQGFAACFSEFCWPSLPNFCLFRGTWRSAFHRLRFSLQAQLLQETGRPQDARMAPMAPSILAGAIITSKITIYITFINLD